MWDFAWIWGVLSNATRDIWVLDFGQPNLYVILYKYVYINMYIYIHIHTYHFLSTFTEQHQENFQRLCGVSADLNSYGRRLMVPSGETSPGQTVKGWNMGDFLPQKKHPVFHKDGILLGG